MHVTVHHWRYEDGLSSPNLGSKFPLDPVPRGWYCWAYPSDDREFEQWMATNCPKSECQHRFNSGDPMYTVQIRDDQEAVSFKLQWM